jgi:hypothetical protein
VDSPASGFGEEVTPSFIMDIYRFLRKAVRDIYRFLMKYSGTMLIMYSAEERLRKRRSRNHSSESSDTKSNAERIANEAGKGGLL